MEVWLSGAFPGIQNQVWRGYSKTSSLAWLHLLFLIPFPNPWVVGDKPVFSTFPWLSFLQVEGNQEEDKVLHDLWSLMWKCEVSAQEAVPAPSPSSDPRSCWVWGWGKLQGEKAALTFKSCFFLCSAGA